MDSSLYNSFHTLLNWQSNSLRTVHVNVRCLWKKLLVVLDCCEWGRNISSSIMSRWKPKITQVCGTIPNLWNYFLLFSFFISVFPLHTLLVPSFIPQILQHITFQIGQYRPHIFYKIVHLNHIITWFISWGLESKTNTGRGRKNSLTPGYSQQFWCCEYFSPVLTCSCIIFFSLWLLKTDRRRYLYGAIIKQNSISNLWIKWTP